MTAIDVACVIGAVVRTRACVANNAYDGSIDVKSAPQRVSVHVVHYKHAAGKRFLMRIATDRCPTKET